MNECSLDKKGRVALYASLAANIFFVAFALGRVGVQAPLPEPLPPPGMGPGEMQRGMMPPMFGPGDLFRTGNDADEDRMHAHFEKMDALRKDFAAQLQAGPVSKEDALKHFGSIDEVMDVVRKEAQERAAEKISAMSETERNHFAERLLSRRGHFIDRMHKRDGETGETSAPPSQKDAPPSSQAQ